MLKKICLQSQGQPEPEQEPELVLFMDTSTGEIRIEAFINVSGQTLEETDGVGQFHTGLVFDSIVAAKIRSAIDRRGVKVKGVPKKCINLSRDWLVQILVVIYHGMRGQEVSDHMAFLYLKRIANLNDNWKQNPGIESQKLKDKDYWEKVTLYMLKHRKADK